MKKQEKAISIALARNKKAGQPVIMAGLHEKNTIPGEPCYLPDITESDLNFVNTLCAEYSPIPIEPLSCLLRDIRHSLSRGMEDISASMQSMDRNFWDKVLNAKAVTFDSGAPIKKNTIHAKARVNFLCHSISYLRKLFLLPWRVSLFSVTNFEADPAFLRAADNTDSFWTANDDGQISIPASSIVFQHYIVPMVKSLRAQREKIYLGMEKEMTISLRYTMFQKIWRFFDSTGLGQHQKRVSTGMVLQHCGLFNITPQSEWTPDASYPTYKQYLADRVKQMVKNNLPQ